VRAFSSYVGASSVLLFLKHRVVDDIIRLDWHQPYHHTKYRTTPIQPRGRSLLANPTSNVCVPSPHRLQRVKRTEW
jgi:hypothetical protein